MGNPLFNNFGPSGQAPQNPVNNMLGFMKQFNQFKSQFRGDPRQKVQELLSSGQMTQEQFAQFSEMAKQFQSMFRSK